MKNACILAASLSLLTQVCLAHRLVTQGADKLAIVGADGTIEWEMEWGGIHDIHVLPGGNLMVQRGPSQVVEIDIETRAVVWTYDAAKSNGNEGKRVEVHAFQPLPGGVMPGGDSHSGRAAPS